MNFHKGERTLIGDPLLRCCVFYQKMAAKKQFSPNFRNIVFCEANPNPNPNPNIWIGHRLFQLTKVLSTYLHTILYSMHQQVIITILIKKILLYGDRCLTGTCCFWNYSPIGTNVCVIFYIDFVRGTPFQKAKIIQKLSVTVY